VKISRFTPAFNQNLEFPAQINNKRVRKYVTDFLNGGFSLQAELRVNG
jgi:hypothetical protein